MFKKIINFILRKPKYYKTICPKCDIIFEAVEPQEEHKLCANCLNEQQENYIQLYKMLVNGHSLHCARKMIFDSQECCCEQENFNFEEEKDMICPHCGHLILT
jgi:hypothetical protein